ncbi:MAG TPA: FAD-dependent oxidoreductase [Candidatus Saccharimonadales bacterium]|nr:FAD-dependent oxidoreductase [Candidatus Saccharimonadales bacterium]
MPVTKNRNIKLIAKRIEEDQSGYFSVYFNRPDNFTFEAGDWIDIGFEGRKLKGGITYSISSSPLESDIRITFREGISEFKKALQSIHEGERLFISQYGNDYGFQLKQNRSSVLIAGGVGIAPFRSMLKEMYENHDKSEVLLIYLNQNEQFLFKDEIDMWSEKLLNLSVSYIVTKDINRKKREKLILSLIKNHAHNFYISGPEGMVESNEHLLIGAGIPVRNIRIDSFGGY